VHANSVGVYVALYQVLQHTLSVAQLRVSAVLWRLVNGHLVRIAGASTRARGALAGCGVHRSCDSRLASSVARGRCHLGNGSAWSVDGLNPTATGCGRPGLLGLAAFRWRSQTFRRHGRRMRLLSTRARSRALLDRLAVLGA